MIYFILSIILLILIGVIYIIKQFKKLNSIRMPKYNKIDKVSDKKVMEDLRYLRKQLLIVDDPKARIEIIKKIEIITSIYN
tara:strand:+ start:130 stop:372 length:243 start_codon:yes stop_codon:yes gene_type:complete